MSIIPETNNFEGTRIIPLPPGVNPEPPVVTPQSSGGRAPLRYSTPLERLQKFTSSQQYLSLPAEKRQSTYERFSRVDPFTQEELIASGKLPLDLSIGGTGPGLITQALAFPSHTAVGAALAPFDSQGREALKQTLRGDVTALAEFEQRKNLPRAVKPILETVLDPLNLVPGFGIVGKGGRGFASSTAKALAREGVEQIGEVGARQAVTQIQPPSVQKLAMLIQQAKPVRETTEALKSGELTQRVGTFRGIAKEGPAEGAFTRGSVALKGELPKADFTPIKPDLTPGDIDSLYSINRNKWIDSGLPLKGLNTEEALTKLLTGTLPTEGEIGLLGETFGTDLAKVLLSKRTLPEKLKQEALSALNLPRAFIASADLSAPMRQGIWLIGGHPKEWFGSMQPMVRAFGSESATRTIDDAIRLRPKFALAEKAGLYHSPLDVGAKLSQREEAYMTRLAGYFPWIRWSERAYMTYLNKLRSDVFDNIVTGWESSAKRFTNQDTTDLADFLNKATGRGTFGKAGNEYAPILNAAFFAPRLVMSRIQAPAKLFTASPRVQKLVAKDMVAFFGAGSAALGILKATGGADVQINPLSSDFGKMRIGPTRYDFWGGEQQLVRFVAQMVTGMRKAISTGEIQDTSRTDTGVRFMRSKFAPAVSLLADYLSGETFFGAPVGDEALTGEIKRTFTPILIQDLWEAIQQQGMLGGLVTVPSVFGAGVQTFYPTGEPFAEEQRKRLIAGIPEQGINIEREEALRQATARERREFREGYPESAQQLDERKLKKISGLPRQLLEIKMARQESEAGLQDEARKGNISLTQYAQRYREIQKEAAIRADEANRKANLYSDEPPKDPLKRAVYDYYQVYKGAQIPGGLDFERVEAQLADLERQWTPEQKQYVADQTGQTEHQSEMARSYEADKEILKNNQYWDAHMELPVVLKYPKLAVYYDEWRRLGDSAFELKYGQYPLSLVKGIAQAVAESREEKRKSHPELDAALVKWYGYKPETIQGAQWKVYIDRQLAGVAH